MQNWKHIVQLFNLKQRILISPHPQVQFLSYTSVQ